MYNIDKVIELLEKSSIDQQKRLFEELVEKLNSAKGMVEVDKLTSNIFSFGNEDLTIMSKILEFKSLYGLNLILLTISHSLVGDNGAEKMLQTLEERENYRTIFLKIADNLVELLKNKDYKKVFRDGHYISFAEMTFELAQYDFIREKFEKVIKELDPEEADFLKQILETKRR